MHKKNVDVMGKVLVDAERSYLVEHCDTIETWVSKSQICDVVPINDGSGLVLITIPSCLAEEKELV